MNKADEELCSCHQLPMLWTKRKERKYGGYWSCRVKLREAQKRWRNKNIIKDRERRRLFMSRYYHNVIMKDPIKIMRLNTQARIRYREKQLKEDK